MTQNTHFINEELSAAYHQMHDQARDLIEAATTAQRAGDTEPAQTLIAAISGWFLALSYLTEETECNMAILTSLSQDPETINGLKTLLSHLEGNQSIYRH